MHLALKPRRLSELVSSPLWAGYPTRANLRSRSCSRTSTNMDCLKLTIEEHSTEHEKRSAENKSVNLDLWWSMYRLRYRMTWINALA